MVQYKKGMTLAEVLAAAVARRGITATEAAHIMGTSQANVSRWLKNSIPEPGHLAAIQSFAEISEDDLARALHASRVSAKPELERRVAQLEEDLAEIKQLVRALQQELLPKRTGSPSSRPRSGPNAR